MMGIEMKLDIPVHYQMGNPLQQGRWPCDLLLRNFNYNTKKISLISMYNVKTRADKSGYTNHRVICLVVIGSSFDSEEVSPPDPNLLNRFPRLHPPPNTNYQESIKTW
jgi:hypothetical protein